MASSPRIQLHLVLPYRHEAREHPRLRALLERGYRIADLQRMTDQEVLVTLETPAQDPHAPAA